MLHVPHNRPTPMPEDRVRVRVSNSEQRIGTVQEKYARGLLERLAELLASFALLLARQANKPGLLAGSLWPVDGSLDLPPILSA